MQLLNELVEDTFINGAATVIAKLQWIPVLGNLDNLRFIVVADQVSGTGLLLTVKLLETPTFRTSGPHSLLLKTLVSAAPVAGQSNFYQASLSDADLLPPSHGLAIRYSLSGTTPAVHLRIWATGRGRA